MDLLTIISYIATAAIGFIGGMAVYVKALHILKDVGTLINDAVASLEDGNLTKAEMEKVILDAKEVLSAVKG